jgi:hypothetical protein
MKNCKSSSLIREFRIYWRKKNIENIPKNQGEKIHLMRGKKDIQT